MAYSYTVTRSDPTTLDGVTYVTYTVVETDAGAATEYTLTGVPTVGTLTLVRAELTVAGAATTMQPEFGETATWTSGAAGHVDQATAAAAYIRIGTNKRLITGGSLYGRTIGDATATTVTTKIVIAYGHI